MGASQNLAHFEQVTIGDPTIKYKGKQTLGWFFYTNKGRYYMVQYQGEALMIDAKSKKLVAKLLLNQQ